MDKFLLLQRILTETYSLAKDKTSLETRLAAHPVRNPKVSILTSLPFYSMKKHDRIITDEVRKGGDYQQRTLKIIPKRPGIRLESVGEFTCNEAVDILMAIGTTKGKFNVSEVKNRGEYQIKTKPKISANIKSVGELSLFREGFLMAIRNNWRKNESRKEGVRWKRKSRFFQKRTADLWV